MRSAQPDARELALKLTRGGHELVQLHRAYLALRTDIDALVGAIPNAVVRSDGPPPAYAWERQLRDLERAVRETPEVEPPLPRWRGLEQRAQQDHVGRREKLRRKRKLTSEEERELDTINRGLGVSAPRVEVA